MNVVLLLLCILQVGWAKRKLSKDSILSENDHFIGDMKERRDFENAFLSHRSLSDQKNFTEYEANNIERPGLSRKLPSNHHKVTSLPGLDPSAPLSHYAGHLSVNKEGSGQLFYWLFEAELDPDTGRQCPI